MRISTSIACLFMSYFVATCLAARQEHIITVDDHGFTPSALCIQPGDSVQWHFVRFGHSVEETIQPGSCETKSTWIGISWRSRRRWTRTFDRPGTVSFMSSVGKDCSERKMMGVVYVGAHCPSTGVPTPQTTPTAMPPTEAPSGIPHPARPVQVPSGASSVTTPPWPLPLLLAFALMLLWA